MIIFTKPCSFWFTFSRYVTGHNFRTIIHNKKVLLRERKSHTARCVANARYAALSYMGGGYAIQFWVG